MMPKNPRLHEDVLYDTREHARLANSRAARKILAYRATHDQLDHRDPVELDVMYQRAADGLCGLPLFVMKPESVGF